MIEFRSSKIVLLGDVHGLKSLCYDVQDDRLNGRDIVQIGDVGLGFASIGTDLERLTIINDVCKLRDINLYLLRGNHDDPSRWTAIRGLTNLCLVPDYTESRFPNGKSALLVGGGISIDRPMRKEGVDYWKEEGTVYQKTDKKFDYLFTHDAPDYFNHSTESLKRSPYAPFLLDDKTLYQDCLNQRNVISNIIADIQPTKVWGGHYHNNQKGHHDGVLYRCLNIDEKYLLDTDLE